jgi:hypothetical protein
MSTPVASCQPVDGEPLWQYNISTGVTLSYPKSRYAMPRISQFFGIIIMMYYNDHLPPHFHARYAEHEVRVAIETLDVVGEGYLPRRAMAMVLEWAALHRAELWTNWERAREGLSLAQVEPLE